MIRKWINIFLNTRPVVAVLKFAQRIKPWGFEGLSLFFVMKFFIEGIQKGSLSTRAAAISFRLFLAIFPALILLLSIIPLVPIENFQESLFESIRAFFPGDTFSIVEETVQDLLHKKHNTLLSIGFILVLFYASNSVNAILQGLSGSYNLEQKNHPLLMRVASILLLIILAILVVAAVLLIIFSGMVLDYVSELQVLPNNGIIVLLDIARWLISVFLIYFSITILYNVADYRASGWKTFTAGASFATVFFILASLAFAYFIGHFSTINKLYGSLGTLLLLLIWTNFNSMIMLLGFELNSSISRAKRNFIQNIN